MYVIIAARMFRHLEKIIFWIFFCLVRGKEVGVVQLSLLTLGLKKGVHKLLTVEFTGFCFFDTYLFALDLLLVFILKHTTDEVKCFMSLKVRFCANLCFGSDESKVCCIFST